MRIVGFLLEVNLVNWCDRAWGSGTEPVGTARLRGLRGRCRVLREAVIGVGPCELDGRLLVGRATWVVVRGSGDRPKLIEVALPLLAINQAAAREKSIRHGHLSILKFWRRQVLAEASAEIDRCFPDGPPPILDPFAGGGAIPLEAQCSL